MRADARRNYERLIAAAREAFSTHGADASLDEIARTAGVGSGTLYRHFPTRDALLEAVIGDGARRLAASAEELAAQHEPLDALRLWLRALIAYQTSVHGLAGTLLACSADEESELNASCALMTAAFELLYDGAQEAGVVRTDVPREDFGRLVHGIASASDACGGDDESLADRLLELALDGVRTTR